jgi:hypothetical protein
LAFDWLPGDLPLGGEQNLNVFSHQRSTTSVSRGWEVWKPHCRLQARTPTRAPCPPCEFSLRLMVWCLLLVVQIALGEEDPANATLVIYNPNFSDSKSLAEYYAARRAIPNERLFALPCSNEEEIDRHEYDSSIAEPVRNHFQEEQLWTIDQSANQRVTSNKVRFIVLIRGIPLKIRKQADYPGDNADPSKPWTPQTKRQWTRNSLRSGFSATRSRGQWRTLTSEASHRLQGQIQTHG